MYFINELCFFNMYIKVRTNFDEFLIFEAKNTQISRG